MKKYTLPYFGELDFSGGEDFYEVEATVGGLSLSLDIDFEGETPSPEALKHVEQFLLQLPISLDKAKACINQELGRTPGFVVDYVSFFKDAIEENGDVDDYIDKSNTDESIEQQLLNRLYLLRVGIYPSGGAFAILDYTIDEEYTDDLLVVYLSKNGEVEGTTIES